MKGKIKNDEIYRNIDFDIWKNKWKKRITMFDNFFDKSLKLMQSTNPMVIPRNHKIEEALTLANDNDLILFNRLIKIFKNPYNTTKDDLEFMEPILDNNKKYQTFCGT